MKAKKKYDTDSRVKKLIQAETLTYQRQFPSETVNTHAPASFLDVLSVW